MDEHERQELIRQELDRLDQLEQVARDVIARKQPLIRDGQVVYDNDGNPVPDPKIAAEANRFMNDLARSRAKLLGTDPPTVIRLSAGATPADVARAIIDTTRDTDDDREDSDWS